MPPQPLAGFDTGGWLVQTDGDGRPHVWDKEGAVNGAVPVVAVGPSGSMRDLLDSVVASPCRVALRVDESGGLIGGVAFEAIAPSLDRQ